MDVDFLNTTSDNQMDLMAMMLQMDKFSEFCEQAPPPPPPAAAAVAPTCADYSISPTANHSFYNAQSSPSPSPSPSVYALQANSLSYLDHGGSPTTAGELSFGDPSFGHKRATSMAAMREMIYRIAAMQPVHIDPESVKPPKRRNVRISKDPQSVAARHRRERISERIRILQRLVPGGTKMDTASMLDEAIHYVKFLKTQVQSLERAQASRSATAGFGGASFAYQDFMNPSQC